ncbi:unnamed protein product [Rhizophagus irregularis]|uniref:UPF0172-domain-containing protein n=1 Tax=Rhizophagus irregularis TaxID=588596 RepID=A0A2I1FSG0_9GLOM|nr:UPF0172-domain-containing protein [Rhizophagus irregularis]CAB4443664.1 unnamed protein product [Rhizophagus irregularis]
MPEYIINKEAYLKIILHACKYPSSTVNGVLLAQEEVGNDDSNKIIIADAVPLFHHWNTLTPMLEVGLQQIEIYAERNKLNIIGYYHANERVDDNKLPPFGQKIASKILENFNINAISLLVQNSKLSPENPEIAIMPYIFKENQWRPDTKAFSSNFALDNNDLPKLVSSSICKKHFEYLYDFDEHLENIELDWLNNIKVVELAFEQNSKTK